jgi:hypothetical protein
MKAILFATLTLLVGSLPALPLDAPKGFETDNVVLYQPNEALQARVGSVADLANYIKELQAVCAEFFVATATPETLHVVVAIRPGKRSRVWFVSSTRPAPDPQREPLLKKLEAVQPCDVRDGPVAFAISSKLAGGDGKNPKGDKDFKPPIPKEWQDAAKGKEGVLVPDGFLDLIWPDGSAFAADTPRTEFVTQILEPTGGKISRPKDWFYHEGHHGPVYDWMLTREDTDNGKKPYTTGVRIQTFTGVKEGTGKTAKQFILDFLAAKKKEAAKVIKTCEPKEQYLFTRICLETEEGPHHILYSLFWGANDLDIAVVTVAGTTKELWTTYEPAFNKMGEFELIDMKRFEK